MEMLSDEIKKVDINEQKLNQMKKLIISAERENIKTGEFTTQDMVKNVRKIIEMLSRRYIVDVNQKYNIK